MCMYLYMHKLLDITSLSRIFMSHPSPIRVLLDKCQELSHMPHGRHLSAGKGQGEPLKCWWFSLIFPTRDPFWSILGKPVDTPFWGHREVCKGLHTSWKYDDQLHFPVLPLRSAPPVVAAGAARASVRSRSTCSSGFEPWWATGIAALLWLMFPGCPDHFWALRQIDQDLPGHRAKIQLNKIELFWVETIIRH